MFLELVEGGWTTDEPAPGPLAYGCSCSLCSGSADAAPQGMSLGQASASSVTSAAAGGAAAALLSGSQWTGDASGTTVITYSFANAGSEYSADSAECAASLMAFSAADQALTRAVLDSISAVCNVTFVEVADNGAECGTVRYAYSQAPNDRGFAGFAFFPSSTPIGGDVWIGRAQAAPQWDFYRPNLVLHETLHAIGLKHPFDGAARLDSQSDVIPNTVMSYSPMAGSTNGSLSRYPGEPMPLDVAALQGLYGAAVHNAGDTVYDLAAAEFQGLRALWDSAGNDTLDAGRVGQSVYLDLQDGARSDIGAQVKASAYFGSAASTTTYASTLALAPGAQIENAAGSSFNDVLRGNEQANALLANAGDDLLFGGGGNDWLDGGAGDDAAGFTGSIANFRIEKSGDSIRVTDRQGGQGTDVLVNVEKLRFDDLSVDLTVQDAAAAVSGARLQAVVELYVGFFNRVPDAEGLGFWLDQMNQGMTTAALADHFYSAAVQYAALTGYSAAMSNEDFVGVIYRNVLGRSSVDAEGLAFWSQSLAQGTETRGSLLDAILGCAHSFKGSTEYGYVASLLSNKFDVAKTFAVDMGLSWNTPEQSIAKGMEIAAAVTPTDMSEALRLIGVGPDHLSVF